MRKSTKYLFKRIISTALVTAMVVVSPIGGNLSKVVSAEEKVYVSEVVLSYGKTKEEATSWLKKNNYKVVDGNINEGTDDGDFLISKDVNVVLMGYKTTTDEKKAIRDLAVMNMSGGYEVTDIETIMKSKNKALMDQIDEFMELSKEYSSNYRVAVKSKARGKNNYAGALKAYDLLNKYIEDDSKKGMGDYILKNIGSNKGKERLFKTLIQSNSETVQVIKNILALAGGDGKDTWIEKMANRNKKMSYYKRIKMMKKTDKRAKAYLDEKYGKYLDVLVSEWKTLHDRFEDYVETTKDINEATKDADNKAEAEKAVDEYFGVDEEKIDDIKDVDLTDLKDKDYEENLETYVEQTKAVNDENYYSETASIMSFLESTDYAGGTLLEFFYQNPTNEDTELNYHNGSLKSSLTDEDLKYECAAVLDAMTDAQVESLGGTVNLFTAIRYAMVDDGSVWNKLKNKVRNKIDNGIDNMEETSIYEGVKREMFEESVALTQAGQTVNKSIFDEPYKTSIASYALLGLGSVLTLLGLSYLTFSVAYLVKICVSVNRVGYAGLAWKGFLVRFNDSIANRLTTLFYGKNYIMDLQDRFQFNLISLEEWNSQLRKVAVVTHSIFIIIGVAVSAIGIYLSLHEIFKIINDKNEYYKGDYSKEIPKYMVDLNYDEDKDAYFNYYEVALCNRNDENMTGYKREGEEAKGLKDYGDINGDTGKQWVALYYSTDETAGEPILADSFVVKYGKNSYDEEYKQLHSFNEPGTGFNLTSSVYCYNDKNNGTYLWYKVDENKDNNKDNSNNSTQAASAFDGRGKVGIAALSGIVGILFGYVVSVLMGRRKKEE
ncbi:MAG: hypothetical protein K6D02_08925 [Lachnospiraceae bacterium]|nr:hypothetical protein [Lachnospiraceae bacterium]